MNLQQKQILRTVLTFLLIFSMLLWAVPAYADDISQLEDKTEDLQTELAGINQELLSISNEIEDTQSQINSTNEELLRLQDSLAISRQNEARQYDDMKSRIKFMYENDSASLLEIMFSSESLSDFLNTANFIQSLSQYDQEKLNQLQEVKAGIETQEEELKASQAELLTLQERLEAQEASLSAKAEETSTDLAKFQEQLKALREEEARKAAEKEAAERAAAEKAAAEKAAAEKAEAEKETANKTETPNNKVDKNESSNNTTSKPSTGTTTGTNNSSSSNSNSNSSSSNTTGSGSSSGSFNYPTSGGVLTPDKGVVYYNGHRETYYSQKVLPGGGLNIPGRHVASDGTIRDKDGYICVASSDLAWGTIVETSLGMGKVYDSGCASGTIDIYTNW